MGGLSLNVIKMESTQIYSVLETQTSAGVQTRTGTKLLGHIVGEPPNAQPKVIILNDEIMLISKDRQTLSYD